MAYNNYIKEDNSPNQSTSHHSRNGASTPEERINDAISAAVESIRNQHAQNPAKPDNSTDLQSVHSFAEVVHTSAESWMLLKTYYRCAMMEIETKFNVLNQEFSLSHDRNPIETIKTRIKTTESLIEKMHRRGVPFNLQAVEENIFDVAGIRVICSFPEDIYMLADCLIEQDDISVIEIKDYVKNPKPNGYRALHLIVEVPIFLRSEKRYMKVEIQLRTIAMDFWASLEHKMRYKKNLDPEVTAVVYDELLECSKAAAELDVRMQTIRRAIDLNELIQ